MASVLDVLDDGGYGAAEVETEWEDDAEDEEDPSPGRRRSAAEVDESPAQEIDEEEDVIERSYGEPEDDRPRSQSTCSRGGSDSGAPGPNKEVWKQFGCNTEAGRLLRKLYNGNPGAAGASKVAYPRLPSPSTHWVADNGPKKPCPQRAPVRVPRAGRRAAPDPDDPRNWRQPLPGRRPGAEILAEMDAAEPERPVLPRGRDQQKEKKKVQDKFQYCGGRMMPPAAMGHVPAAEMPEPAPNVAMERRVVDDNGMTAEHRDIFVELTLAVQRKQARLAQIDASEGEDPKPSKAKTERNKEALQLKNDIDRCLKDIDKLLELTEDDAHGSRS